MRKHRIIIGIGILLLLGSVTQVTADAVKFKSKKPLYAAIAINEKGDKILKLVFDESGGTGNGYDDLYADTNFNGVFEQSERYSGKKSFQSGTFKSEFPTISVSDGVMIKRPSGSMVPANTLSLTLSYTRNTSDEKIEVQCGWILRQKTAAWHYYSKSKLKPSSDLNKAPIQRLYSPQIRIDVGPDKRKKGQVGIAIQLENEGSRMTCSKDSKSSSVDLVITNASGSVVKQDSGAPSKFGLG